MKKISFHLPLFCFFFMLLLSTYVLPAYAYAKVIETQAVTGQIQEQQPKPADAQALDLEEHQTSEAPGWTVVPFILLLLMIATGPLFFERFWHRNYPIIAVALATAMVLFYLFFLQNVPIVIHTLAEYIQFIALLTSLFIASGGILIDIDRRVTPIANVVLLLTGAVISNLIGTTGASMLLIRPFIRLNGERIKPYHIIFFIFMVSNLGGSLTPIGDPPLFLGFLKGIPFFWTLQHNLLPWLFALVILAGIFYVFDIRNKNNIGRKEDQVHHTNKITIAGARNFGWLMVIIIAVFIDPNVFPEWVPGIQYHGQVFSYIREVILLSVAYLSYRYASRKALSANDFSFEPIREVAFIFIGIFGTMMPALELVAGFAQSEGGAAFITHNTLYWATGLLSSFLDNAPTYLNFLAAAMASKGADLSNLQEVAVFSQGGYPNSVLELKAISIAAVFFGAMTYIGNGPNFMVKSIAEQIGVKMPSFFGYIILYSIPVLLPILILVWLIFFAFN